MAREVAGLEFTEIALAVEVRLQALLAPLVRRLMRDDRERTRPSRRGGRRSGTPSPSAQRDGRRGRVSGAS